jgi:Cys-tRNA synthase (O-phospho-L-seryl-tRNA:Cys-tRNA synthase)
MTHATSLRAIGQSLEKARVTVFEIENNGDKYLVLSNSLTHRMMRFTSTDVLRQEAQARQQRGWHLFSRRLTRRKLSQALRSLGDQLDRAEAREFHISWTPLRVVVNSSYANGLSDTRSFTATELQRLGSPLRRRQTRSRRSLDLSHR